jgi:hypothetical protein
MRSSTNRYYTFLGRFFPYFSISWLSISTPKL